MKSVCLVLLLVALSLAQKAPTCTTYDGCGVCNGDGSTCSGTCYPQSMADIDYSSKITICHGTASSTNPYVMINVAAEAVAGHFDGTAPGHGHRNHPDIYLGKVGAYQYTYDCECESVDLCPEDPTKTDPGVCGCGVPDTIDPNTGLVSCTCNFVPADSCEIGCRCFSFRLTDAVTVGANTELTFAVSNLCGTPLTYIAIAASGTTRVAPADGAVVNGYTVVHTGAGIEPFYANGFKFVPTTSVVGGTTSFTITVAGYNPSSTQFTLMGHTADVWEPFTFEQDPSCACNCPTTCPPGFTAASGCSECGSDVAGFEYWCALTPSMQNPYTLTLIPIGSVRPAGSAPGSTDEAGFVLDCDCSVDTTECPDNCMANGLCNRATGTCTCDPGFIGANCAPETPTNTTTVDDCRDLNYCTGNGVCQNGACVCSGSFTGIACTDLPNIGCIDISECDPCGKTAGCTWCRTSSGAGQCSEVATCVEPVAACWPTTIEYVPPPCPDACSGNGRCEGDRCVCDDGYKGINCGAVAGLSTAEAVAVGLGAGILALIIVGAVVFVILSVGGGVAAYKYTMMRASSMDGVADNPLYEDGGKTGRNPFYRMTKIFSK